MFFLSESRLLKKYEQRIANKAIMIAVSKQDAKLYQELLGAQQTYFLPVFVPYNAISSKKGTGAYCLYHGNLAINENEEAVTWLLESVLNNLDIPFVIAGKNPSAKLQLLVNEYKHATLIADPSDEKMQELIADAQINVLPSLNKTGVKLKVLNALFNGRHCVVNKAAVDGSGVEHFCYIAESAGEFKECIKQLYQHDFTYIEIQQRQNVLKYYNNELNAQQLISWIH